MLDGQHTRTGWIDAWHASPATPWSCSLHLADRGNKSGGSSGRCTSGQGLRRRRSSYLRGSDGRRRNATELCQTISGDSAGEGFGSFHRGFCSLESIVYSIQAFFCIFIAVGTLPSFPVTHITGSVSSLYVYVHIYTLDGFRKAARPGLQQTTNNCLNDCQLF